MEFEKEDVDLDKAEINNKSDENLPSKKDFIRYSILVFIGGALGGFGISHYLQNKRGKRKIKEE
ncbi:MAG: hypothetical protein ACOCT9_00340 [archaeon]